MTLKNYFMAGISGVSKNKPLFTN